MERLSGWVNLVLGMEACALMRLLCLVGAGLGDAASDDFDEPSGDVSVVKCACSGVAHEDWCDWCSVGFG